MNKRLISLVCAVCIALSAHAQSILDPSDSVYADIRVWQAEGAVGLLPQLRPYPAQLIKHILDKVEAKGSERQSARAKYQYERLFGKRPVLGVKAEAVAKAGTGNADKQAVAGPFLAGTIEPVDLTSVSFDIGLLASNKEVRTLISPRYSASRWDIADDPMDITSSLKGYFSGNADVAFGTPDTYVAAGLNRSSWGDFLYDGVVISPEAFHSGNLTASVSRGNWNYSMSLFSLTASDNVGERLFPQKYLALHSFTIRPAENFDITVFETMVYGNRFEPIYLIPVVPRMLTQAVAGFSDNLMMGVALKVRPIRGLDWNTTMLVDDANLNKIAKGNIDAQVKFAGQTAFVWVPGIETVQTVELGYTAVMPYMYTHASSKSSNKDINYQNYTNYGINLGSQLQPNSDRVSLKATVTPVNGVRIAVGGSFVRHANVNESLPEEIARKYIAGYKSDGSALNGTALSTNGTVYNFAEEFDTGCYKWAKDHFLFLAQDTKEYKVGGNLDATWELPKKAWGRISLNAGYDCEYIVNSGVDSDMYVFSPDPAGVDIAAAKNAWKANLKNALNNYFTVGMKYSW